MDPTYKLAGLHSFVIHAWQAAEEALGRRLDRRLLFPCMIQFQSMSGGGENGRGDLRFLVDVL